MVSPARSTFARAAETSSPPADGAPPALLLHGQPGAGRDWQAVLAALEGQVRALAPDRPGWDGLTEARDLAGNAAAAVAALNELSDEPVTIVGHSLGAAIAVLAALEVPERVAALVLVAPAVNRASLGALDRWLARPGVGEVMSGASLTGLGLALGAEPLRRRVARQSGLSDGYLRASGRGLLTSWARRAFVTEQRALIREIPQLEARLGQVSTPTWILTGSADRIVPRRAPRALAGEIHGSELIEVRGAGHMLPQLNADQVADTIRSVLTAGAARQTRVGGRQPSSSRRRSEPI